MTGYVSQRVATTDFPSRLGMNTICRRTTFATRAGSNSVSATTTSAMPTPRGARRGSNAACRGTASAFGQLRLAGMLVRSCKDFEN